MAYKNKEVREAYMKKYRQENKEALKAYDKKYRTSYDGKFLHAKSDAKSRGLGFNLVYYIPYNWHGRIEYCYHHINDNDVVVVPLSMHRFCLGLSVEQHRKKMQKFINYIYNT